MSTTVASIRTGLKNSLSGITAQCTGYVLSNPTPPAFEIELSDTGVEYDQTFNRGLDKWTFLVRGIVAYTTDQGAEISRDTWMDASGTTSVKALLEADRTLGGVVQNLHVISAVPRTYGGVVNGNQVIYLGAEWTVEVYASA